MERRRVIIGGGTALAVAFAGCSAITGSEDDDGGYTEWLPASIADEGVRASIMMVRLSSMADIEGLPDDEVDDFIGHEPDAIEFVVDVTRTEGDEARSGYTVLVGDTDSETARDGVEDLLRLELEEADEYAPYDVYTALGGDWTVGTGDGVIILAETREWFEAVADVHEGDATLLVDVDERFELLDSRLDYRDLVDITLLAPDQGRDGQATGFGTGVEFGQDETDGMLVSVFEDEDAAEEAREKQRQRDADVLHTLAGVTVEAEDIDVEVDGRFLVQTTTIPTDEFRE